MKKQNKVMETKEVITIDGVSYPVFDLTKRYANNQYVQKEIKKFKAENELILSPVSVGGEIKAGDVIRIISGENKDLVYEVEVLGFHHLTGNAYLVWDCYWVCKDLNKCMVK